MALYSHDNSDFTELFDASHIVFAYVSVVEGYIKFPFKIKCTYTVQDVLADLKFQR